MGKTINYARLQVAVTGSMIDDVAKPEIKEFSLSCTTATNEQLHKSEGILFDEMKVLKKFGDDGWTLVNKEVFEEASTHPKISKLLHLIYIFVK